ncbi:MAG: bifunctional DNA primase/polymerase [Thermanaerothrix sp.]|uniref:bifunctional DNA primase/polymerase n=1 Tax=Thermanaerothrix sp. TaxID=2972675 RepID=UPI003C79EFA8
MDVLSEAIKWFGLGVSVVPVRSRSKVAAVRWTEYTRRLPTPEELIRWFARPLFRNYGVICGKRHGQPGYLAVLDFDNLDAGLDWLLSMRTQTYTVATARGLHAYFITDEPAQTTNFAGGNLKGNGYVMAAGSVHPSGAIYTVLTDAPIANIRSIREVLPDLPEPEPVKREPRPPAILSKPEPQDAWESAEWQRPNLIETIRARFDLRDFLMGARKTDASGRWWLARCPLHDDHNPSMWIDAERQLCGCYAGCNGGRPMDIVNLAAALWNCSNSEAVERLRQML